MALRLRVLLMGFRTRYRDVGDAMKIERSGRFLALGLASTMLMTLVANSAFAQQSQPKSRPDAASILNSIHTELMGKTKVPLRLPSYIPFAGDPANPLYAILKSADSDGYEIELSWLPECSGGNYCHFGTILGSSAPLAEEKGRKEKFVRLRGGIRGIFVSFTCGANCDDSTVTWSEGKFRYSMSIKGGKESDLIDMVNSSLATNIANK